jgi:hypothetical protein
MYVQLTPTFYCTMLLLHEQEAYPVDKLVKLMEDTTANGSSSSASSSSAAALTNGAAANGSTAGQQLMRSHSASGIQLPMNEWGIDDARLWLTSVAAQHQLSPAHVHVSAVSFTDISEVLPLSRSTSCCWSRLDGDRFLLMFALISSNTYRSVCRAADATCVSGMSGSTAAVLAP